MEKECIFLHRAACAQLRSRSLQALLNVNSMLFYAGMILAHTKVQIGLPRQHQSLRFDALHCSVKVPVVRLLSRAVASLPGVQHREHVFWVWKQSAVSSIGRLWRFDTFGQSPRLPKVDHEVFQIPETERWRGLVHLLPIEWLAEAPAGIAVEVSGRSLPGSPARALTHDPKPLIQLSSPLRSTYDTGPGRLHLCKCRQTRQTCR